MKEIVRKLDAMESRLKEVNLAINLINLGRGSTVVVVDTGSQVARLELPQRQIAVIHAALASEKEELCDLIKKLKDRMEIAKELLVGYY